MLILNQVKQYWLNKRRIRKINAINKYLTKLNKVINYLRKYPNLINNYMLSKEYKKLVHDFPTRELSSKVSQYPTTMSYFTIMQVDLRHFTSKNDNDWPTYLHIIHKGKLQELRYASDSLGVYNRLAKTSDLLKGVEATQQYMIALKDKLGNEPKQLCKQYKNIINDTRKRELAIKKLRLKRA